MNKLAVTFTGAGGIGSSLRGGPAEASLPVRRWRGGAGLALTMSLTQGAMRMEMWVPLAGATAPTGC